MSTEDERLTDDDKARLTAIMGAVDDPERLAGLIYEYYRESARADRTSRSSMYLHMGILAGALLRAVRR
jgi:hypothetical protein